MDSFCDGNAILTEHRISIKYSADASEPMHDVCSMYKDYVQRQSNTKLNLNIFQIWLRYVDKIKSAKLWKWLRVIEWLRTLNNR